jgi:hypothetical protein
MKTRSLLLATVLTLLCTGFFLTYAGWFAGSSSRRPDARSHARAHDGFNSDAAWRYRRCQPVHWRAMMLQH